MVMDTIKPLDSTSVGRSQDMNIWVAFKRLVMTFLGGVVGTEVRRDATVNSSPGLPIKLISNLYLELI